MENFHVPVLLKEILNFFSFEMKIFVDGTLGAAGHSFEILQNHPELKKWIGFDQDSLAIEISKNRLLSFADKSTFFHANFKDMENYLKDYEGQIDGILLDLGVSSMQLDRSERGFSFSKEGPLDMRMDSRNEMSAKEIINQFSEAELGIIFKELAEEPKWRQAAKAIINARMKKKIETTKDLADILTPILGGRNRKIHPLTLIFQGLRIFINQELVVLEGFLKSSLKLLKKEGRLAIITFHSLEDRIVKQFFKFEASSFIPSPAFLVEPVKKNPSIKILTKKPVEATFEEIKRNPRSRSAKLRVVEKL